jgi:hypothetical protein
MIHLSLRQYVMLQHCTPSARPLLHQCDDKEPQLTLCALLTVQCDWGCTTSSAHSGTHIAVGFGSNVISSFTTSSPTHTTTLTSSFHNYISSFNFFPPVLFTEIRHWSWGQNYKRHHPIPF